MIGLRVAIDRKIAGQYLHYPLKVFATAVINPTCDLAAACVVGARGRSNNERGQTRSLQRTDTSLTIHPT